MLRIQSPQFDSGRSLATTALMLIPFVVLSVVGAAPDFCGSYTPSNSDSNVYRVDKTNAALTVEAVAQALCDKPGDEARQVMREGWANDIAKEWLISPQLAQGAITSRIDASGFQSDLSDFCKKNKPDPDDFAGAGLRAAWSCLAACGGCRDLSLYSDSAVDVGTVLTVGRLAAYLPFGIGYSKKKVNSEALDENALGQPGAATQAGSLLLDLERFDEKAYLAEVDDLKAPPRVTQLLKENFYATRAWHQKVSAFYEKKSKNQAYKRIVFDAPRAAFASWKASTGKLVPFDTLVAAEKAILSSSEGVKTCAEALRPGLKVLVKQSKGKDRKEVFRSISQVDWRFAVSLARCEEEAGRGLVGGVIRGTLVDHESPMWGPRFAAYGASVLAYQDVLASPKNPFDGKFNVSSFGLGGLDALTDRGSKVPSSDPDQGPIASMKPAGDSVEFTFSKVTWKEELENCVDKKPLKLARYNLVTGLVQYEQVCTPAGFETHTAKAKPVRIPKAYSAGLKKGQWLEFEYSSDGSGMPVISFTDNKKTKVATLFGLAVK